MKIVGGIFLCGFGTDRKSQLFSPVFHWGFSIIMLHVFMIQHPLEPVDILLIMNKVDTPM